MKSLLFYVKCQKNSNINNASICHRAVNIPRVYLMFEVFTFYPIEKRPGIFSEKILILFESSVAMTENADEHLRSLNARRRSRYADDYIRSLNARREAPVA